MLLFDRKCVLYVFAGNQKYTIDDLHMSFRISLTEKPEPNTAEITVFGLSNEVRQLFSEEHQGIEFHAGYGTETSMIFKGVTTNVTHRKESVDWETSIYAYDGFDSIIDAKNKFNKAYRKGVKIKHIVKDIAKHIAIPYAIDTISDSDVVPYGTVYSGVVKTVLNQIAIDFDLSWSIQMNYLLVSGARILMDPFAVLLTPETGMIGSPTMSERTEQLKKKKKKKAKPKRIPYVEVTSLLNPKILPGKLLEIKADRTDLRTGKPTTEKAKRTDANGVYFISDATFYGDNFEGDFYVDAIADAGEDIFYYKTFRGAQQASV